MSDLKYRKNNESKSLQEDLEPEDFVRVADARRDIWSGGFRGLVIGTGLSALGVLGGFSRYRKLLGRNEIFFSMLGGGSLGAFVGSMRTGKAAIGTLGDIFERYGQPGKTEYQKQQEFSSNQQTILEEKRSQERIESIQKQFVEDFQRQRGIQAIKEQDERKQGPAIHHDEDEKEQSETEERR